ncbi:MAG: hypothetical protein IIB61_03360 [Planctomycetes bacterium]|nr:hypothetical protein [Planctomycetota bacterium]
MAAVAAVVSLALEFGFETLPVPFSGLIITQCAAVVLYAASRIWSVAIASNRRKAVRLLRFDGVLLAAALTYLAGFAALSGERLLEAGKLCVAVLQGVLIVRLALVAVRWNLLVAQSRLHPTRLMTLTFLVLIVTGTIALALPRATQPHVREAPGYSLPRHVLNCVFTATSATCVTGLTVYDTGTDLTIYGQVVILVLIQIGGLGIMIFGTVFGLLAGRQMSLRQSLILQDAISYRTIGEMRKMITFIVLATFLTEAIGAVVLYPMWQGVDTAGERAFASVFHAVSAFCNAGFALQSDSLMAYSRAWQVYGCVMPLIVVGGIGFPVLYDLWQWARRGVRRAIVRRTQTAATGAKPRRHRPSVHTKLVLTMTVVLILASTIGFFALDLVHHARAAETVATAGGEQEPVADSRTVPGRLLDALFLSVTCRTAGFNTIAMDVDSMPAAGHLLACVLMFIGGAPASTAGGIKCVTLGVLLLGVWATLRGRANVEAFGRTIPESTVRRAGVILIVMTSLIAVGVMLLVTTDGVSVREALFETVSACGTTGLTTGLTPRLTTAGRAIIMAAMFAGRIGPLAVLIALAGGVRPSRYEYPTEDVGIG